MTDSKIPANPPAHIAQDEAFALALARQECVEAGLGTPETLTDDFVRASQHDRLLQVQTSRNGSPRLAAPSTAPRVHADPSRISTLSPVIDKEQAISGSHAHKFDRVGDSTPEQIQASRLRAQEVQQKVSECCRIVPVRGDGNCGYYAVLAGAVHKALESAPVREGMTRGLQALCARDWTDALARIARHPAHHGPEQAANAQALGKRTLRQLATLLASPTPRDALDLIENPAHEPDLVAAHYILRAVVATEGVADPEGSEHGAGCAYARPEDINRVFQKLVDNAAASCVTITTRHNPGDSNASIDDIHRDSRGPGTLLLLHSNNNHYDLLLHKTPLARL